MDQLRVLFLEDSAADAQSALRSLGKTGLECKTTVVASRARFEDAFAPGRFDLVLSGYKLPDYDWVEALRHVRERDALMPFLLISGTIGEEHAVEALRAGATDYVLKTGLTRLAPAVRRALLERRERERHLATQRALADSEERLRGLTRRLIQVQEEERSHLARELHDEIGQALTALKIQLETLARASNGRAAEAQLKQGAQTTGVALERVRQLSLSLRPSQLDDLGLEAALRSHLHSQALIGGLVPHFDASEAPGSLEPQVETACFRVAQEAITNILRHAGASNVWLSLQGDAARLRLSVRDDGAGFDLDAARRRAAASGSLGLVGMEERVALVGGRLELHSAPGKGTDLIATFPAPPARAKETQVAEKTIRVALADDHTLVRAGIRSLLQGMAGVEVIGEAGSGEEALALAAEEPDVILLDLAMKGMTGLEAAKRMRELHPRVKVLILSMHSSEEYVLQALRAGAAGYLVKDSATTELELALRAVTRGRDAAEPGGVAPGRGRLRAAHGRRGAGRSDHGAAARNPADDRAGPQHQGDRLRAEPHREDGGDAPRPDHGAAGHPRSGRAGALRHAHRAHTPRNLSSPLSAPAGAFSPSLWPTRRHPGGRACAR